MLAAGNSATAARRASEILSKEVPSGTIRQWIRRPWWTEAENIARILLQRDLEHKYTRLLHKTEEQMLDRVENGDVKLTKDGEQIRVPVTLRDLTGNHILISDKRAMIRGEPTSRKDSSGVDLLVQLMDKLQARGEERVRAGSIPGEYEVVETPQEIEHDESTQAE